MVFNLEIGEAMVGNQTPSLETRYVRVHYSFGKRFPRSYSESMLK